jgi:hypothetical protein
MLDKTIELMIRHGIMEFHQPAFDIEYVWNRNPGKVVIRLAHGKYAGHCIPGWYKEAWPGVPITHASEFIKAFDVPEYQIGF